MQVDLNCDLGEGFPFDAELMRWITSANVACGAHAGDPITMCQTVRLAKLHAVQVGAHPGHFDRVHFGRVELRLEPLIIFQECVYQIGALASIAQTVDVTLHYVKPHGALYNHACREQPIAEAVVDAAQEFDLAIMGLPQSELARSAQTKGCRFIKEGFADRRYQPDGTLVPRTQPNAYIEETSEAVEQAIQLIQEHEIESICVHGDHPQAFQYIKQLRHAFAEQSIAVKAISLE